MMSREGNKIPVSETVAASTLPCNLLGHFHNGSSVCGDLPIQFAWLIWAWMDHLRQSNQSSVVW